MTTVKKEESVMEKLAVHANYIIKIFDAVFECDQPPIVKPEKDKEFISVLLGDLALLYLKYDDKREKVICVVSVHDESSAVVIAELISCLKDVFGGDLVVNDEPFVQDEVNHGFIWGRKNIDYHNEKCWGRKITHTIWFDDSLAGHS